MTDAEIAALKAAALKATPGAWKLGRRSKFRQYISGRDWDNFAAVYVALDDGVGGAVPSDEGAANAAYIIAAHPAAILALIARLEATERSRDWYRCACAEADDRAQAAEARAERLAAVLEAEREERRAERAVQEAENAMCRAQERDDPDAERRHVKWHADACEALNLAHQRAEAARAALAQLVAAAVRDPTPEGV